ncbi:mannitol-1-phosphate 5-dehydrogenase [Agromyces aerolatus]|uniref:mannitol-1-phosphate 5-dehydrogenase n=1 Tax=Agromyces sp. LY-1074 TaxID=3074080 RepID=UPI0028639DD7|nr:MULTISPECIES: mannitol-1-phosphate 5-dehydrogenase [unclassified Agromyces]MDR5698375.1 mannitol-1-phosphate 5-dehydrogenase [Agromyces sp. LY-1074]MDR5704669.1 mannitol-1-phosphate 5-dehydrogenase [Agromyces sp. LY-1358]
MTTAVHFGAGNIGRGFVGLLLHEAGYEVVFADVDRPLIERLEAAEHYTVHEVGPGGSDHRVDRFRAIDSSTDAPRLVAELETAAVVTTAVGPRVLRFIAPHVLEGLRGRAADLPPLAIMACENAINATALLRDEMASLTTPEEWATLVPRAIFANTAVDRIVPGQRADAGLDVTVETFFEWAIERSPFGDRPPEIPGAHYVDDLAPYIERKLFTVNTGHASIAYLGAATGHARISDALADPAVRGAVERALEETSALIVADHAFTAEAQADYRRRILERFANPELPDTVERVGRQPLRKLSRKERFIEPAARLAARGAPVDGLLAAIAAALRFRSAADEESLELGRLLSVLDATAFVDQVMGIEAGHPLYPRLEALVRDAQAELAAPRA